MKQSKLTNFLGIVIAALTIHIFYSIFGDAGVILAAPIAGGIWNEDMQVFRRNLETTVGKRIWWKSKLSQLMSFIDYDKYKKTGAYGSVKGSKLPTEAIIHIVNDFKSKKGVKMDFPITSPLTELGRTGTESLENHGEARKLFNSELAINMKRHALLARDNEMSEQVLNPNIAKVLMSRDGSELQDWFSRYLGFEAWFSVFEGWARNLTDSSHGLDYSKKSHPNIAVQGDSVLAFDTTAGAHTANTFDAGWEVILATSLATLTDVAADHFNADSVSNMIYLARQNKIQPINVGGKEYYIIFITSAQAKQLRADSTWTDYYKNAGVRGDSNPLFTGALEGLPFEGSYVIVDDTIPSASITGDSNFVAADSTTGDSTGVCYHVTEFMAYPRDTGPRKAAVLMGQGAIRFAEGKGFTLSEEIKDHGQKIEVGGTMIYGASRADIIDTDNYLGNGANLFVENSSSLLYFTYSPDSITI